MCNSYGRRTRKLHKIQPLLEHLHLKVPTSTTTIKTKAKIIETFNNDDTADATSVDSKVQQQQQRQSLVTFGSVEIREYSRCLGDNPSTCQGPPLSIDWDYVPLGSFDLNNETTSEDEEEQEQQHHEKCCTVPPDMRMAMLLDQTDTTMCEIQRVNQEIRLARHQRQLCINMQEFESYQVVFESIQRKFKRFVNGTSTKREQQLLWEHAAAAHHHHHQQQSCSNNNNNTMVVVPTVGEKLLGDEDCCGGSAEGTVDTVDSMSSSDSIAANDNDVIVEC